MYHPRERCTSNKKETEVQGKGVIIGFYVPVGDYISNHNRSECYPVPNWKTFEKLFLLEEKANHFSLHSECYRARQVVWHLIRLSISYFNMLL